MEHKSSPVHLLFIPFVPQARSAGCAPVAFRFFSEGVGIETASCRAPAISAVPAMQDAIEILQLKYKFYSPL